MESSLAAKEGSSRECSLRLCEGTDYRYLWQLRAAIFEDLERALTRRLQCRGSGLDEIILKSSLQSFMRIIFIGGGKSRLVQICPALFRIEK